MESFRKLKYSKWIWLFCFAYFGNKWSNFSRPLGKRVNWLLLIILYPLFLQVMCEK